MKIQLHKIIILLVCIQLLNTQASARDFSPVKKTASPSMIAESSDPSFNMLLLSAGVALGGKQNTAYFLKAKSTLFNKLNMDASMFYHINLTSLYNANISFGKVVAFSAGVEWGERTYFINRDSTFEIVKFKNTATGEYANYSSLVGFTMPEQVTTYCFGLNFRSKFISTNYWRGKGKCWTVIDFKWEGMFAPKISYDDMVNFTPQSPLEQQEQTYDLEGVKVKHWGIRMVADSRLSSKLGFMMEFGLRPGIKSNVNDKGTFSNGYVKMGVELGFMLGGRKALHAAG